MPSRKLCPAVGTGTTVSSRQDRLTGEHADGQRAERSATETAVCVASRCLAGRTELLLLDRPGNSRAAALPARRHRGLRRHRPLRHVRRHAFGGRAHQRSSQGPRRRALSACRGRPRTGACRRARGQTSTTGTSRRRFVGTARRRSGDHPPGRPATIRRSRSLKIGGILDTAESEPLSVGFYAARGTPPRGDGREPDPRRRSAASASVTGLSFAKPSLSDPHCGQNPVTGHVRAIRSSGEVAAEPGSSR